MKKHHIFGLLLAALSTGCGTTGLFDGELEVPGISSEDAEELIADACSKRYQVLMHASGLAATCLFARDAHQTGPQGTQGAQASQPVPMMPAQPGPGAGPTASPEAMGMAPSGS